MRTRGVRTYHRIDKVHFGPGSIEQAHKPDEYVEAAELAKSDAFMERLVAHASVG